MKKTLGIALKVGFLAVYIFSLMIPTTSAFAAANLTITPITWGVVGLDSNDVLDGPNNFPVGARVCNNGDATANNVVADFVWDDGLNDFTGNTYINLRTGSLSVTNLGSIAAGTCEDAYFEVTITRDSGAYNQTRDFHITADSDETSLISTPTPREIYVEKLVSQNRNSVTNILLDGTSIAAGGTMNLNIGQTYTITLVGSTATNGYEQIESFVNFPNTIFQINSVAATYDAFPTPHTDPDWASKLYADGCGWVSDPTDVTTPAYRECAGTGKYGGNITITYNVTIIASSASSGNQLNTLIYDFSGSSYHYNSDFSTSARIYNIIDPNVCTAVTIAQWTFPTSGTTLTPSTDNASGTPTLTTNSLTGPTDLAGNPTRAASYTFWNTGARNLASDYALFSVSTEGYYNINFSYDLQRNNNGPTQVSAAWDNNGSGTPTALTAEALASNTWTSFSKDLSAETTLDNASAARFFIYGHNASNTNGAMRLDNITVSGCKLPSGLSLAKSGSPAQFAAAGATITYTYTLTNTGQVSLQSPYTITDDKVVPANISCVGATSPLAPGASTTCTGTYTTTSGDVTAGLVTNIASAASTTVIGDAVTSNNATETVELSPNLTVSKTNNVSGTVQLGNPFNWTLAVTNTGGTSTFNDGDVILVDNLPSGPTYGSVTVTNGGTAPGGTGTISCSITSNVLTCTASGGPVTFGNNASFSAVFSVTAASGGSLVNPTGGVCSADPNNVVTEGNESDNSCTDTVLVANPSLNIVKEVSTDNSTWNDTSVTVNVGATVFYRVRVANTGNVTLTGLVVDDGMAGCTLTRGTDITGDNDANFEAGEEWSYTCSVTAVAGTQNNTATADSNETPLDSDTASYFGNDPSLNIVKEVSTDNATWNDTSVTVNVGATVFYRVRVANTGNITLTGLVVDDGMAGCTLTRGTDITGDNDADFEVGEEWSYTCSVTAIAGTNNNTATADSNETPLDSDNASYFGNNPSLNIVKEVSTDNSTWNDTSVTVNVGATVFYRVRVANTGNITLTGLVVDDGMAGCTLTRGTDITGDNDADFEVGEEWSYTCSVTAVAGTQNNTATADSNETPLDSDNASYFGNDPSLNIVKEVSTDNATWNDTSVTVNVGATVFYRVRVANTGNITLTGLTVDDGMAGCTLTRGTDITGDNDTDFEVGEEWSYTCSVTAVAGTQNNTATADSNETPLDSDNASYFGNDPSLNIVKEVSTDNATWNDTSVTVNVGDTVFYRVRVANTGNITLTGLTVDDGMAGCTLTHGTDITGDNDAVFEVGEEWSYTCSVTAVAGTQNNTATADSNETPLDSDNASYFGNDPSLNIVKEVSTDNSTWNDTSVTVNVGDTVFYRVRVANTGNITLTGLTVDDGMAGCTLTRGTDITGDNDTDFEVGEEWSYTCSVTAIAGVQDNTATADSNETPLDSDDASYSGNTPSLNIVKEVSTDNSTWNDTSVTVNVGDTVFYRVRVTNTGNITLTGLTVDDGMAGCTLTRGADISGDNDTDFEIGEEWSYTCSVIAVAGTNNNTATADSNETPQDSDTASYFGNDPSLNIVKEVSTDNATWNDTSVTVNVGDTVYYQVRVANTGNITLTGLTVDDGMAGCTLTRGTDITGDNDTDFEVGEEWSYTCSVIAIAGTQNNTATADSNETPQDSDNASYFGNDPSLNIVKEVSTDNSTWNDTSVTVNVGDTVFYRVRVANTGNITLTGLTVDDGMAGCTLTRGTDITGDNDTDFEVGEEWSYTCSVIAVAGTNNNTATADSNETPQDSDNASYFGNDPSLNIVKEVSTDNATWNDTSVTVNVGDTVFYRVRVANTGNITLTGLVVDDGMAGCTLTRGTDITGDNDANFEVGEEWSYTCSVIAVAGTNNNTATADSNETPLDSDNASYSGNTPSLNVVKEVSIDNATWNDTSVTVNVGDTVFYRVRVTNTGNITLTGLVVDDGMAGCTLTRGTDITGDNDADFEVGEEWSYTCSVTAIAGTNNNTATADSNETPLDSDNASYFGNNPSLNIVKEVSTDNSTWNDTSVTVNVGATVFYRVRVANTGNITLTGLTVDDGMAGCTLTRGTDIIGDNDASFEVGEEWSYTCSVTAVAGTQNNTATADSNETPQDSDNASYFGNDPSLNIVKEVSTDNATWNDTSVTVNVGDTVFYRVRVANTGNITLTGLTVDDGMAGCTLTRGADITGDDDVDFEAGEEWSYTCSVTAIAGTQNNTATADSNETPQDSDNASYFGNDPSLNIVKEVSTDNATWNDTSVTVNVGDTVFYRVRVANTGNITLTGLTVDDGMAGCTLTRGADITGDDDTDFEVGEEWSYTCSVTALGGTNNNIATADSNETPQDSDDASYFGNDPSFNIVKEVSTDNATWNDTSVTVNVGDTVYYRVRVENTGNITLTGLTVDDGMAGCTLTRGADITGDDDTDFEAGEEWSYTCSVIAVAGTQNNTATADSNETPQDSDNASYFGNDPSLNIVKEVSTDNATWNDTSVIVNVSDTVYYRVRVENTGNITLTGLTVDDGMAGCTLTRGADITGDDDTDFEIGEEWSYTCSVTALAGTNNNTATADSNETPQDSDDASYFGNDPSLNIVKEVSTDNATWNDTSVTVNVGDTVYYRVRVENTGNITLTGLTVDDGMAGCTLTRGADITGDNDTDFEAGEEWAYTCSVTAIIGTNNNTATADSNETPQDSDDASYFGSDPSLNIVKEVSTDNATWNDTSVTVNVGDTVYYQVRVENTGNITLTGFVVDDGMAGCTLTRGADITGDNDADFEAGEEWSYTCSVIAVAGSNNNTATADSNETPLDSDNASYFGNDPSFNIVKEVSTDNATWNDTSVTVNVGDTVYYRVRVENTGNITLTGLTVDDGMAGCTLTRGTDITGDNDTDFEAGEEWVYTCSVIAVAGTNNNTATADSNETPQDSDDASYFGNDPSLNIVKEVSTDNATWNDTSVTVTVGDTVYYRIRVANTGNITLTGLTVDDGMAGCTLTRGTDITGDDDTDFEVGEEWSYTCSITALGGTNNNTATADSNETPQDSDTASYFGNGPALNIVKEVSTDNSTWNDTSVTVNVGDTVYYRVRVENTGNITLTGLTVDDGMAGCTLTRGTDITGDNDTDFEAGEEWSYTCSITAIAGSQDNTATADSTETPQDSDNANYFGNDPSLNIVKEVSTDNATWNDTSVTVNAGDTVYYLIRVENTGNITLTGLTVDDGMAGCTLTRGTDITGDNDTDFEAGEEWSYTCSVTAMAGTNNNTATADSNETPQDSDTASYTGNAPALVVDKTDALFTDVNGNTLVDQGDTIQYTVVITNNGTGDANSVTFADSPDTNTTLVVGSVTTTQGTITLGNTGGDTSVGANIGTLAASGGTVTITFNVTVNSGLPANVTSVANQALVSGSNFTDTESNDPDTTPPDDPTVTPLNTTLFDPPSVLKTLNEVGLPELEFRMVWINSGNLAAIDVQVTDNIPVGTTYVANSITCEERGTSTRAAAVSSPLSGTAVPTPPCGFDAGNNRIQWQGTIAPDNGILATDPNAETNAANEIVITFRVTVNDGINQVMNIGSARTDVDDDTDFDEEQTLGTSLINSNQVVWNRSSTPEPEPVELPEVLPATGFAPNRVTALPEQPADKSYLATDVWLEVPRLGLKMPIVGVPLAEDDWDLTWLWNEAGWLEGTAFPSWQGNSVLTGHVTLPNGESGPFASLGKLAWGDRVIIHAYGDVYVYEVRQNRTVSSNNTSVLQHEDEPWVTLLTCKTFNEATGTYSNRIAIRAVLIGSAEDRTTSRNIR